MVPGGTWAVDAARVRQAVVEEQRVHGVARIVVLLDVAPAAGDCVAAPGATANSSVIARSQGTIQLTLPVVLELI